MAETLSSTPKVWQAQKPQPATSFMVHLVAWNCTFRVLLADSF